MTSESRIGYPLVQVKSSGIHLLFCTLCLAQRVHAFVRAASHHSVGGCTSFDITTTSKNPRFGHVVLDSSTNQHEVLDCFRAGKVERQEQGDPKVGTYFQLMIVRRGWWNGDGGVGNSKYVCSHSHSAKLERGFQCVALLHSS